MTFENIDAEKLRKLIRHSRENLEIVDVREPEEYRIVHIKGSKLIPMNELLRRLIEIDWNKEVVFVCRSGSRSAMMAMLLMARGKAVKNLHSGIFECHADGKSEFLEALPDEVEGYFQALRKG